MHEDIDRRERERVPVAAWHQFLDWFDKIINEQALLEKKSDEVDTNVRATAKDSKSAVSRFD